MSVIIPTHSRAGLVREAINSVLSQRKAGTEFDLECIVVDDASCDDTEKVVRAFPVTYMRLAGGSGMSAARNAGIKASGGKYIAFLDDDDLMLPQRLSVQVPVLETRPEIGVVYSQNIVRGKGIEKIWSDARCSTTAAGEFEKAWPDGRRAPSGDVFNAFLIEEFISINTPLVRRDAFEKAGLFDEQLTNMEHYDMFLRLAFYVPFVFVEEAVAINRVNWEGAFHSHLLGLKGYARMLPKVIEKVLLMLPDTVYSRQLRRKVHEALVPRLFCMLGRIQDIDGLRRYTQMVLSASPWLLTEADPRNAVAAQALSSVAAPFSLLTATRVVCEEIKAAARDKLDWLRLRLLLGGIWMAVANRMAFESAGHGALALYATVRACWYDPRRIGSRDCARLALRLVCGTRVYYYLAELKRAPRAVTVVNALRALMSADFGKMMAQLRVKPKV